MCLLLYLVKCLYLSPWALLFYLSDSFPHPTWGKWASGCVVLSCLVGLNHHTSLQVFVHINKIPSETSLPQAEQSEEHGEGKSGRANKNHCSLAIQGGYTNIWPCWWDIVSSPSQSCLTRACAVHPTALLFPHKAPGLSSNAGMLRIWKYLIIKAFLDFF